MSLLVRTGNLQLWQTPNDFHRLQTDRDNPLKELERIGRVADRLDGVAVGVVNNAAAFVIAYALALHHPFERGLAVHHDLSVLADSFGILYSDKDADMRSTVGEAVFDDRNWRACRG